MRIFLTGATGFVGQEIAIQLRSAGHPLAILARDPNSRRARELLSRCQAEVHTGDVQNPASLEPALRGTDAVVHLVGIISEVGRSTFENVHVRGTENVVAAARNTGVRRFIHMRALGTRPSAVSRYHQTKWAAEEIVRQSGLDFTIFRPSLIFGARDHFVNLFARIIRLSPVVPVMGTGRSRFQPVAVESVAAAFVRALSEPRSLGRTFDLCGPDTLTLPAMLDATMAASGRKRWKVPVPLPVARCQAAVLEFIFPRLLRRAPPLNRDQLVMLEEDNVGDAQPADELFGLTPVPFREGIGKYLA